MNWSQLIRDTCRTGGLGVITSTAVIAACGAMEINNAVAPFNAISHIAFGDEAALQDRASWKFTGTGFALSAIAVIMWAGIFEFCFRRWKRRSMIMALVGGIAVSAMAYVIDYQIVPERLTPGFEKRLSNTSLFAIYAALALTFAASKYLAPGESPGARSP